MTKSITQSRSSKQARKLRKVLSPQTRQFLADFHNFTNKWPTQRIAQLPEINVSRQAVYKLADRSEKKEVHE